MKREDHFGRMVVFLAALFFVVVILPAMIAGGSGQLEIPVAHDFSVHEETVVFHPENGWHIQSAAAESSLVLEDVPDVGGMLMSVSELDAGESESVRFQCRRDSALEAEHVELTYTISRENDGGFTMRIYPEHSELLNVNYVYTYEAERV